MIERTIATNRLSQITSTLMTRRGLDRMTAWRRAIKENPVLARRAGRADDEADDDEAVDIDPDDDTRHDRRCNSCGQFNSSEAKFCTDCGSELDDDEDDEKDDEVNMNGPQSATHDRISRLAQQRQAGTPGMSFEQAYRAVLEERPQLYSDYLREREGARVRKELAAAGIKIA